MKKLKVNNEICIGCGACCATYPEILEFSDEGVAQVIEANENQEDETVEEIEGICPVGAIYSEELEN